MTEILSLEMGIIIAASLMQLIFGLLLAVPASFNKSWGVRYLGNALITAAAANAFLVIRTDYVDLVNSFKIIGALGQFFFGFYSLALMLVGTAIYAGIELKYPKIKALILALILIGTTIITLKLGWPSSGRFLSLAVFISCALLAFRANQLEPKSYFWQLGSLYLAYVAFVILARLLDVPLARVTPFAALFYAAIGALTIAIILNRRTQEITTLLVQRDEISQQLVDLNTTLESKVAERTQDLKETLESLRTTQQDLVQSQKLAALTSLVTGIAHMLNTPIGTAYTAVTMLKEAEKKFSKISSSKLTKADLEDFQEDIKEGVRLADMGLIDATKLVKSFQKIDMKKSAFKAEAIKLTQLEDESRIYLFDWVRDNPNIQLGFHYDKNATFTCYREPLILVIQQLIKNCYEHAFADRSNGSISIDLLVTPQQTFTICVKDDGLGIPEESKKHIFEPFFTTKMGQGTSGLGMHIVHNLVTHVLDGKVNVSTNPERGSEVTITVPLTDFATESMALDS